MAISRSFSVFCAAMLGAALAAAPARAADDEHPYKHLQRMGAVHKIIADIDQASFAKAVAHYPWIGHDGPYRIAMGRYMIWKIVDQFQPDDRVSGIRLTRYGQRCWPRKGFVGGYTVWCDMSASLLVSANGVDHALSFAVKAQNVGAYFDPARRDYWPALRSEVRMQVDAAVASFAADMRRRGILRRP